MDFVIRAISVMAATCFFGLLLHQPKSTLVFTALIGWLGYEIYLLAGSGLLAFFVSGLFVGILCELVARRVRRTTTLFLISSIIPTVPGLGLYRTMMAISENKLDLALKIGLDTLGGIGALALAVTMSTLIFSLIRPLKRVNIHKEAR